MARRRMVLGLLLVAAAALRGVFLLFPALDSDQAIIGLMGLHILEGRFPIFFWGEQYSGTLESFLAAPLFFVFGASRQTLSLAPTLVSLGFLWAGWRLAREVFGERAGLIALALLAVPPVFLSWNSVLPRGNYTENLLLGTLCLLLALRLGTADLASARGRRLTLLLGGLAGFAWYMSFQSVHYLAAAALYLAWRRRLALVRALPLALAAFLVGSLPFWIANLRTGFASLEAVRWYSGRVGIAEGLRQLAGHLPVLLGVQGFTYTYENVHVGALPLLAPLAGGVFVAGVAVALMAGLVRRRPRGIVLLALLSAIVLVVIVLGGFSLGDDPRHLLPLYSALPLLLAGGIALAWRWRPLAVGALALLLASNLYGHWSLAQGEIERFPRYRAEDRQLLDFLRARGFDYVYAPDYWLGYRLTFDAREEPVIATPFWRDFPRSMSKFPPYTRLVEAESRPVYLLWGSVEVYRGALRAAGIQHEATRMGRFTVLHGFRQPAAGRSLPAAAWRGGDGSAAKAFDRDLWTLWQGTEFRLDLGAVHRVNQVVLHLGDLHRHPSSFVVEGSLDGQDWQRLAELKDVIPGFAWAGDKLLLEEHGRVGLVLAPTPIRYLRVLPRPADRPWALAELFVFEAADGGPSPRFLEGVALEEDRQWGEALSWYTALLLDEPDDERALLRATVAAWELRLDGWAAVYDFLSARTLDRDPELALRFARRFHELADYREAAWHRLARALVGVGDRAAAAAVEAAMIRHFTPGVTRDVQFGRYLRFLGYTLEPSAVSPGDTLRVSYFWQLLRPLPPGFWIFVHVDEQRRIRLIQDHQFLQTVPHPSWRPGETIRETYTLQVPAELNAGTYALRLGVWKPASGRRLKVWHGWWPTRQDVATVGTLEVSHPALAAGGEEP